MISCNQMLIKRILHVVKREVREIIHDRLYLSILLILPIVMLSFFAIMFHDGTIKKLPIVLVDNDKSDMSRTLKRMLSATRGVDVAYESQSIDEAETMLLSGDVYGIIFIEDGFGSSIYRGIPVKVECYVSGTNMSASGVIERDVQTVVRTFSAGISLSVLEAQGMSSNEAMVDIMPINFQTNIVANPYLNYGYYLAPIFMFMCVVVFVTLSTIYAVGRELRYATAPLWLQQADGSLVAALAGKMLPIFIIMFLLSQAISSVLFVVMGMECSCSYVELILAVAMLIIAYQSIGIFIISMTSDLRLGLSLGGGYAVMAFTFSGITFPTMAMFCVPRVLSYIFPLTYFSNIFVDQVMYGATLSDVSFEFVLFALFLLLVPISWSRLRRVVSCDKYWGKD